MVNHEEPVGIGDQVIIKHDSNDGSRDWVGEPSGEIVAAADDHGWDAVVGVMSAEFPWTVSFDSPQFLQDGSGPFTETTVEAWRLEHAPIGDDNSDVEAAATGQDTTATH